MPIGIKNKQTGATIIFSPAVHFTEGFPEAAKMYKIFQQIHVPFFQPPQNW